MTSIYDVAGIGIGPFNLSLACMCEPLHELKTIFFDRKSEFSWHPGLMLPGTTLQTPFLCDLVTMADPTSRFSFLNFLKQSNRIYPFYIKESFFPSRLEYNHYCRWAASQLSNLRFSSEVISIDYNDHDKYYLLKVKSVKDGVTQIYRARRIVIGVGTTPCLPAGLSESENSFHAAHYLSQRSSVIASGSVIVVGSGQSAAEIFSDLLDQYSDHDNELTWVTRSPRFYPLEYAKLTLEMTSSEYIDHFYHLPDKQRSALGATHDSLYKGINEELINSIYDRIYDLSVFGPVKIKLIGNSSVIGIDKSDCGIMKLLCHHNELNRDYALVGKKIIFATGYERLVPKFIEGIKKRIRWTSEGYYAPTRNYTVDIDDGGIFVQNGDLATHGISGPDLGMGCYRNSVILRSILGYAPYKVEKRTTFQDFRLTGHGIQERHDMSARALSA